MSIKISIVRTGSTPEERTVEQGTTVAGLNLRADANQSVRYFIGGREVPKDYVLQSNDTVVVLGQVYNG